jgi:hypothetical protein
VAKVRVYELAKEFGVESKVVLAKLTDMGEFVRSASSTIEAPVVKKLKDAFPAAAPADGDAKPAKKAAAKKTAAKKVVVKAVAKKATVSSPASTPTVGCRGEVRGCIRTRTASTARSDIERFLGPCAWGARSISLMCVTRSRHQMQRRTVLPLVRNRRTRRKQVLSDERSMSTQP